MQHAATVDLVPADPPGLGIGDVSTQVECPVTGGAILDRVLQLRAESLFRVPALQLAGNHRLEAVDGFRRLATGNDERADFLESKQVHLQVLRPRRDATALGALDGLDDHVRVRRRQLDAGIGDGQQQFGHPVIRIRTRRDHRATRAEDIRQPCFVAVVGLGRDEACDLVRVAFDERLDSVEHGMDPSCFGHLDHQGADTLVDQAAPHGLVHGLVERKLGQDFAG